MHELFAINEDIDVFFQMFALATTGAVMDWKRQ